MISVALTAALSFSQPKAASVQPALDVVVRQFGAHAASSLQLSIDPGLNCGAKSEVKDTEAASRCFHLSQPSASTIAIAATSMSELTYGIGYYARFSCGFTVGWAHGGGSYTGNASTAWPCHGDDTLPSTTLAS